MSADLKEFVPLTMSPEEWDDCTLRGRPSMIKKLKAEVLAHARAGEALRRELDQAQSERDTVIHEFAQKVLGWSEDDAVRAMTTRAMKAEADLASLRARLQ